MKLNMLSSPTPLKLGLDPENYQPSWPLKFEYFMCKISCWAPRILSGLLKLLFQGAQLTTATKLPSFVCFISNQSASQLVRNSSDHTFIVLQGYSIKYNKMLYKSTYLSIFTKNRLQVCGPCGRGKSTHPQIATSAATSYVKEKNHIN